MLSFLYVFLVFQVLISAVSSANPSDIQDLGSSCTPTSNCDALLKIVSTLPNLFGSSYGRELRTISVERRPLMCRDLSIIKSCDEYYMLKCAPGALRGDVSTINSLLNKSCPVTNLNMISLPEAVVFGTGPTQIVVVPTLTNPVVPVYTITTEATGTLASPTASDPAVLVPFAESNTTVAVIVPDNETLFVQVIPADNSTWSLPDMYNDTDSRQDKNNTSMLIPLQNNTVIMPLVSVNGTVEAPMVMPSSNNKILLLPVYLTVTSTTTRTPPSSSSTNLHCGHGFVAVMILHLCFYISAFSSN